MQGVVVGVVDTDVVAVVDGVDDIVDVGVEDGLVD